MVPNNCFWVREGAEVVGLFQITLKNGFQTARVIGGGWGMWPPEKGYSAASVEKGDGGGGGKRTTSSRNF